MSETVTERGPCTECGTPHAACVGPDYCCDECLHLDANWEGYEQPQPARPVGGDTHAELRDEIEGALISVGLRNRERLDRYTDAVLALPAVRDALAAQETVRRVRLYVDHPGLPDPTCRKLIRRALAGES